MFFFVACSPVRCRNRMLWISCDALSCDAYIRRSRRKKSLNTYLVNNNLIQSLVNILTLWPSKVVLRKLTKEISRSGCT